ncbi:MAG: HWE histidine kinase domain-containing protein [Pseudomonadota bacterium]
MNEHLKQTDIEEAMADCANEPVHIPGTIQPIGYLIACHAQTGIINYATENCFEIFEGGPAAIFGLHLRDLLGNEIWHSLTNFSNNSDFDSKRDFIGVWSRQGKDYAIHSVQSGDYVSLEIEAAAEIPALTTDMLQQQTFLVNQIQACTDQAGLFDLSARLLRHITGFDRVMIYRFDAEANGEVLEEARKPGLESYNGMRFPSWDIPAQARAIMARIPMRMICDVDQQPVPILAANADLPPLDIALAQLRGVSPVHLQYLRNMGSGATMTLSVVLDGQLWGIISFHHGKPKVVPGQIRQILISGFLPVFCLKLNMLLQKGLIDLSMGLDQLQSNVQLALEKSTDISEVLNDAGPLICKFLDLSGICIVSGSQSYGYGVRPGQAVIESLVKAATDSEDKLLMTDNLQTRFPGDYSPSEEAAGALVSVHSGSRALLLFRAEIQQQVHWAGNPEKTIETVDGNKRLLPRDSFSAYLEKVEGRSKAWSPDDRRLPSQLWPLLGAAERQAYMNDVTRQQKLMIGELNHRVRNILSLVKSVSHQARRHNSSLASYSQALEARVHALAAAHDIGSGAIHASVSVAEIIRLESNPYNNGDDGQRVRRVGPDFSIRAENAPIFALVVHELMTNAVKYGALSEPKGWVEIETKQASDHVQLLWVEKGGPPVAEPESKGFGTVLIEQAVPYEMNGKSEISFLRDGVEAKLILPLEMLDLSNFKRGKAAEVTEPVDAPISSRLRQGLIMILEDNFMIATDLQSELRELGLETTEILGRVADALEFLEDETPVLALLDVNLGRGETSEAVASALVKRGVPVIYITGYGDQVSMPAHLSNIPVLTKPVSRAELAQCLASFI